MEYCLVNIVLGDSEVGKPTPEPPKLDKIFELAKVSRVLEPALRRVSLVV